MKDYPKVGSFIYLASPYSHASDAVMIQRYEAALDFLGLAVVDPMLSGFFIFSPVATWHPVAIRKCLPKSAVFWRQTNEREMLHAHAVFILDIPGWKESVGVSFEIDFAHRLCIPVYVATPDYDRCEVILCPIP